MSLTMFLALAILGCDFLLYALFQWIFGEKHREHARRVAAREKRRTLSTKQAGHSRVLPFPERTSRLRTGYESGLCDPCVEPSFGPAGSSSGFLPRTFLHQSATAK
jgi:hypothetical protein